MRHHLYTHMHISVQGCFCAPPAMLYKPPTNECDHIHVHQTATKAAAGAHVLERTQPTKCATLPQYQRRLLRRDVCNHSLSIRPRQPITSSPLLLQLTGDRALIAPSHTNQLPSNTA